MRGQKPKLAPALIHMGRGGAFEAGNIVAPEAKAAGGQRKPGPEGFRHGDIGGEIIAAPVQGHLLGTGGGAAGKKHRLIPALYLTDDLPHGPVIQISIVIMHAHRVGAVEIANAPHGNALAKVGLEGVHAHFQNAPQMAAIPVPGGGIGEVHHRQASLPKVALPHVAIFLFQEIALFQALVEQG